MTTKQKKFVKEYQETGNATEAYRRAYNVKPTTSRGTIQTEAKRTLRKPSIRSALDSNVELFESKIVQTVKDWGDSDNTRRREIAMQNAQWGHDKVLGKATQRVESRNTSVEVKIDLTGVRLGTHYVSAPTSASLETEKTEPEG